jgi:hypothetical protein
MRAHQPARRPNPNQCTPFILISAAVDPPDTQNGHLARNFPRFSTKFKRDIECAAMAMGVCLICPIDWDVVSSIKACEHEVMSLKTLRLFFFMAQNRLILKIVSISVKFLFVTVKFKIQTV